MKNWVAEFKRGRSSVVDEHRSGRPKDAASAVNMQIINGMLNKDRRLTIRHIPMFYPSVPPVPINVPLLTGACSIFNRFVFIVSIVLSLYRLCTLSCTFFMHV